jgi:hypothetical protein
MIRKIREINRVARWAWLALVVPAVITGEGVAYAFALLNNAQAPAIGIDGARVPMEAIVLIVTFLAGVLVTVGVSIEQLRRLRVDVAGLSRGLTDRDEKIEAMRNHITLIDLDFARVKEHLGMRHFDARLHRPKPDDGRGE